MIWSLIRRRRSERITGEVVEYYQDSQLHYVPVLQFTSGEKTYKLKLDRGFRRKIADEGQFLEILFMPKHEEYVKLARDRRDILYSIILLILGIVSLFFLTV